MEKRYLVGYVFGQEAIMFDDIKDFEETYDAETNLTTITFKEGDETYTYVGNDRRGFTEVDGKAPYMTSYKTMGRRTAMKHDLFKDRVDANDVLDDEETLEDEEEWDDDDEENEFLRHVMAGHCGYHPHRNCGHSSRGSCGGYGGGC